MADSDRDPSPIERFEPSGYLEGSWRVAQLVPGKLLRLEQDRAAQVRKTRHLVAATVLPLVQAGMLLVATAGASAELRWVIWPVVVMLVVMALFGLLSLRRGIRQVREGVRLEIDARAG